MFLCVVMDWGVFVMIKKNRVIVFFSFLFIFVVAGFNQNLIAKSFDTFLVSNEDELKGAISHCISNDYIKFENDIEIKGNLNIDKSLVIDLNGKSLYLGDSVSSILVGKSEFSHTETRREWAPRIVVPNRLGANNRLEFLDVVRFVSGLMAKKTEQKYIYNYHDEIELKIKNGTIQHVDGVGGKDGVDDTWMDYNGKKGERPNEVIRVISGTVRLYDVVVYGGHGGNGGDGRSQSLLHIPFGGGSAGKGGNGGNGGDVIRLTRKENGVFSYGCTKLIPGKGGNGGKKGSKNESYWVYSGWNGKDGKNGKEGYGIRKVYKKAA